MEAVAKATRKPRVKKTPIVAANSLDELLQKAKQLPKKKAGHEILAERRAAAAAVSAAMIKDQKILEIIKAFEASGHSAVDTMTAINAIDQAKQIRLVDIKKIREQGKKAK